MLTFRNSLICPIALSKIKSRFSNEIDTSVDINGLRLNVPIISSPMDSIESPKFFNKIVLLGGVGILHRFMSIQKQVDIFDKSPKKTILAIGTKKEDIERFEALYDLGGRYFLIDVANGFSSNIDMVFDYVAKKNCWLMTGNVANGWGFQWLQLKGAHAVRVGIGTGSACSTRLMTGIGYPLLSGLDECYLNKNTSGIIADGGLKMPSDLVKSLFCGADAVMMGNVFSRCVESKDGLKIGSRRIYRGMASHSAMEAAGKPIRGVEGEEFEVVIDRSLEDVFGHFTSGLRSAMSYLNAPKIKDMRKNGIIINIADANGEGFQSI